MRAIAHIAPLVVFLALTQLIPLIKIDNPELPWWRSAPEHWVYPVQTVICLAMILFCWRKGAYQFRPVKGIGLGVVMGFVGIAIWLVPPVVHHFTGLGGETSWLRYLGFSERLEGFDPTLLSETGRPVLWEVGLRFLRMVVCVALVEEIFWRGFLMRWLIDSPKRWSEIEIGHFEWKSFLVTTLMFASVHFGPDFGVALIYGALAGWVTVKTRSLTSVIIMHAIANLILGLVALKTGWWGLW